MNEAVVPKIPMLKELEDRLQLYGLLCAGTPERGGGAEGQAPPLPFSKRSKGALLV